MHPHQGIRSALIACLMLTASCSTTTFTEWSGASVIHGSGGTVRRVGGIDFWEVGEPDRDYAIIGVINDSRRDHWLTPGSDSAIAEVAKKHGGDAVVFASRDKELVSINNNGNARHQLLSRVVVVKYVK